MSIRWCGTAARSAGVGLAVPMSMPRYTRAESTLTISAGTSPARASATALLPLAVGPAMQMAGVSGMSLSVGQWIERLRSRPAIEEAAERAEEYIEQAVELTQDALGSVATQTRAVGERAAKFVGVAGKGDAPAKKAAKKAPAKKTAAKKAPVKAAVKKAPAKKAPAKKVTQK